MMTVGLAAAFDHTKTNDRDATNLLAESVKSVGHIAVVLSRHIVRRGWSLERNLLKIEKMHLKLMFR